MKTEKTYHIDVTPEEDALFNPGANIEKREIKSPVSFTRVFCIVLGVHVVLGIGILATTHSVQAKQHEPVSSRASVQELSETINKPAPSSNSTSTPTVADTESKPAPVISKQVPKINEKYTKEYTVKQGDTLSSIARKYKLSTARLIKINNIKDVNKLVIGQKLKFL